MAAQGSAPGARSPRTPRSQQQPVRASASTLTASLSRGCTDWPGRNLAHAWMSQLGHRGRCSAQSLLSLAACCEAFAPNSASTFQYCTISVVPSCIGRRSPRWSPIALRDTERHLFTSSKTTTRGVAHQSSHSSCLLSLFSRPLQVGRYLKLDRSYLQKDYGNVPF